MYKSIKRTAQGRKKFQKISVIPVKGVNGLTANEFQGDTYAQIINGYKIRQEGVLEKVKGINQLQTLGLGTSQMVLNYDENIIYWQDGADIYTYNLTTTANTLVFTMPSSGPCFGHVYGGFVYLANGVDQIHIGKNGEDMFLIQNGATLFQAGEVITGGTSGATATIGNISDTGSGSQICTISNQVGIFIVSEALTGSFGGAGLAQATAGVAFMPGFAAPQASTLHVHNGRMYADARNAPGRIQWSPVDDVEFGVPFFQWGNNANPPLPNDPFRLFNKNLGDPKSISNFGEQTVVFFENGKIGFRVGQLDVSGVGLIQNTVVDFEYSDFGGERRSLYTPKGIFYANEKGVWRLINGGTTDQPFTKNDINISLILGIDFINDISFDDMDMIYDEFEDIIYIMCKKGVTTENNFMLMYNIGNEAWTYIEGSASQFNFKRFMKTRDRFFAVENGSNAILNEIFVGDDYDGSNYATNFEQEVSLGNLTGLYSLESVDLKGFISSGTNLRIRFSIYDKDGTYQAFTKSLDMTTSPLVGDSLEISMHRRITIRQFSRLVVTIDSSDQKPHKITWFSLNLAERGYNRFQKNLTL
jgi:hypothetical protein